VVLQQRIELSAKIGVRAAHLIQKLAPALLFQLDGPEEKLLDSGRFICECAKREDEY
jgi:hypothetical protein